MNDDVKPLTMDDIPADWKKDARFVVSRIRATVEALEAARAEVEMLKTTAKWSVPKGIHEQTLNAQAEAWVLERERWVEANNKLSAEVEALTKERAICLDRAQLTEPMLRAAQQEVERLRGALEHVRDCCDEGVEIDMTRITAALKGRP